MDVLDEIFRTFDERGAEAYFGEDVTQLEHALQSSALARAEEAPDSLVTAALLHDFGHLVHGLAENVADHGIDARHEALGEKWLKRYFGRAVTDPVRLHVAAKRYLCAVDPAYFALLSPASVQSLKLQGGPMSAEERQAFEAEPHFREALRLRRWDDQAKIPGLDVPGLESYRGVLRRQLALAR
jgi:phosphonate degradation associated HDIG domain protein